MAEDLSTNFTAFFTFLIAQEKKLRNKPKAGRPARDLSPEDKFMDFFNSRPIFGPEDQPKTYFNGITAGPKEHAWEAEKDRRLKETM